MTRAELPVDRLRVHRVAARPHARARRRPRGAARGASPTQPLSSAELVRARSPRARDRRPLDGRVRLPRAALRARRRRSAPWPHTKPSPFVLWREPLPDARESADAGRARVPRRATGRRRATTSSQFTGFKLAPDRPGARRPARRSPTSRAHALRRAARAARSRRRSGAGALPAGVRLDHPRAPRPRADRPGRVPRRRVQQEERDDEEHVHGRRVRRRGVADREGASWRSSRSRRCPTQARREVDAEGERLLAWYVARARRASARARARRAAPRGRPRRRRCRGSPRARPPAA